MCSACFEAHQRLKATRGHPNVLIDKLQAQDVGELIRRPVMCIQKYHENEALEYYCQECKDCICMKCGFVSHNGHTMVDVQQASDELKMQMANVTDKAKAQMVVVERKINTQIGLMRKSSNEMFATQDRVSETVDELVGFLREYEKATKKKLSEINEMQITHHATQLENLRLVVSELKRSVEYGEVILQRNIAHEILQAENTVICRLEELLNVSETKVCEGLHFTYIPNKQIIHAVKSLGLGRTVVSLAEPSLSVAYGDGLKTAELNTETNFTVTTRDSEGNQYYNEEDLVTVEICSSTGDEETDIVDCKDGNYRVCYTPKCAGQHSVVIRLNGQSLPGSPWSVHVTSHHYRYHSKALFSNWSREGQREGSQMFLFPCGIAQSEKTGSIAVADYEKQEVLLFDWRLTSLKTTLKMGKTKPRSVAFTKFFDVIVVHEESPKSSKMSVFTEGGQFVKDISDKLINNPCSVSVGADGKLIVCDSRDISVKVLSPDGTELLQTFKVPNCDAFPWFAIYHREKYFVSYRMACCVKVFSKEGVPLYDIEGWSPAGLAVDKFNNLIVCDTGNKTVKVFTPHGEFLNSFQGFNESSCPCSVAVTRDGDIMVSDVKGKCIQVFCM